MNTDDLSARVHKALPHGAICKDGVWTALEDGHLIVYDDPSQSWPALRPEQIVQQIENCKCGGTGVGYFDFHDNPPKLRPLAATGVFGKALVAEGRNDGPCPSCGPLRALVEAT